MSERASEHTIEQTKRRTRDLTRAIVRLIQDFEAIDWYRAPIGVVAVDAEGLILAWNEAAGSILGVREWEVLATPLIDLFEGDARRELERLIAECVATDARCEPEVFERRQPELQFVEVTATGLRSRTAEPGATLLLQDVTKRVVAERARAEAEQRFRTLVEGLEAIVWEAEPATLRFTFVSKRAEEILGYPVGDWLSQPDFLAAHIHPDDRARAIAHYQESIAEGRDHRFEYRMRAADGREVWLRDQVTVLRDAEGRPNRLFGVMVDISERKRTEQALARLYTRAEEDAERKDEFLATLAHELRTPLGAIASALGALAHPTASDDTKGEARQIIANQMRHLTATVDELLQAAGISAGRTELERRRVDLNDVVRSALAALETHFGGWRHRLVFAPAASPVIVHGDPLRLEQVVRNLLENAVKYTPEGGPISVAVAREATEGVIRVADAGAGIPPEIQERIFEPFYQARPSAGGLGLGLAVVRRLVELHGGTVSVHSEGDGRGSEFVIRVPLAASAARSATRGRPAAEPRRGRVLVVEDHPDMRDLLRSMLEQEQYEVATAEDGPRGIEAARSAQFDVAVIDLGLPGLTGYEVARKLRTRRRRRPFLIALTGYAQSEDPRRAEDAGFDAYLVKPVDQATLAVCIEQGLRK
jgi:PAS domain S-box-containing protein